MIDIKLKYQASLFLDAVDIQAVPENITFFMNTFLEKQLIPTTFQEFDFPNIIPLNRIRLSSPNNEWVFQISSKRIDIEKISIDIHGSNLGAVDDFCDVAK